MDSDHNLNEVNKNSIDLNNNIDIDWKDKCFNENEIKMKNGDLKQANQLKTNDQENFIVLLCNDKTKSIIDSSSNNSTTVAANILINSVSTPVTAIESALTIISVSNSSLNSLDQNSFSNELLDETTLNTSVGDIDFDSNSLSKVTDCFNIKTEPDEKLSNDNASNSSNGSSGNNNYANQQLNLANNGLRDAIGSPSTLTSLKSHSNGASPGGRQSTSASSINNTSVSSANSNSNSLVNLNSPSNLNDSNSTNSNIRVSSGNIIQQLDYSQAFTTAASTTSANSTVNAGNNGGLVNYHVAGQLSHLQTNQHQNNLNAGQTALAQQSTQHHSHQQPTHHSTHHHHSNTTQTTNSNNIFTNTSSTNSHSHHHSHHLSHHNSNHTNNNSNIVLYNNDLPDTKEGLDELCPVCGDKVSGYHYGLLTCESCKGFFKRTVQNKKVYNCVAERQCHIDKSQRKRCPYCRFQKCINVGMKLEAVRADRMRGGRNKFGPMYKRDRARRMQLLRQRQQQILLNSSLNSNASSSPNSISISTSNTNSSTSVTAAAVAAVCAANVGNLGSLGNSAAAHGNASNGNEPYSLLNTGILYSADGIKQELIQIPHLSSSTSSPDSSPSPISGSGLSTANNNSNNNSNNLANLSGNSIQTSNGPFSSVAATHPELAKWVNGSINNNGAAGSAPSPIGNLGLNSNTVGSLAAGLANSSLSSNNSNNLKQGTNNNTSFGFIKNRNSSSWGQITPSFLNASAATGSMMLTSISAATASSSSGRLPLVIRELQLTAPDDKDWQSQLFTLLNSQTYNQVEVDLFELMCKVIEQNLFSQVDWARNSIYFKDLNIDDQMKLLQHSWSHLLALDHIHQRIHHGLQDESSLPNGQNFNLISLALLGEPGATPEMISLQHTLTELKFDHVDYICVKFLLLLNPEIRGLLNHRLVQEAHEQTQHALHQYTINCYPLITDKFNKLMAELPKLRQLTARGEEFLYQKHISGNAPTATLLHEMLSTRRI